MLISLIALLRRYSRYSSELDSINRLDDRSLRDIGLSRRELAAAARNHSRTQYP